MSINKSGEFVRSNEQKPEEELNPVFKLTYMYNGFSGESVHPHFAEKPDNVRYWWDVEHMQKMLDNMKKFADEKKIVQIIHPVSGEAVVLKDFFDLVERSIEYSKGINERIKTEPPPPDDLTADKRRRIRELLEGQKGKGEEEIMRRRKIL